MINFENFRLSRIYSSWVRDHYDIVLLGYENNLKKLKSYKVKYYDYFFVNKDNIKLFEVLALDNNGLYIDYDQLHYNLYKKPYYKVYYSNLSTFRLVNNLYKNTLVIYMSDIKPHQKYLYLNRDRLKWSLDRHILFIDILNVFDRSKPDENKPHLALLPITSIQTYSSFTEQFYIISWHPLRKYDDKVSIRTEGNINYILCNNLKLCLLYFIQLVKDLKPDIFVGWNSRNFDMPYIINRSRNIKIPIELISPLRSLYVKQVGRKWDVYMQGIEHLDLADLLVKLDIKLTDGKLATAAKLIIKDDSVFKITEVTWKDWIPNYDGFLKYGIRDVLILIQVDKIRNVLRTFSVVQQITNIYTILKIHSQTYMSLSNVFNSNWGEKVYPNKMLFLKINYKGAYVMDPAEPGLHHNVAVLDFASLYPTTMIWSNVSPETHIISQLEALKLGIDIDKDIIPGLIKKGVKFLDTGYDLELFGKRHIFMAQETKVGFITKVQLDMYKRRVLIKHQRDLLELNTDLYVILNATQFVYKILLNACYGAFASTYFRFYKPEVALTITYFARKSIHMAKDFFMLKYNMKMLYGDTDSLFININDEDPKNIHKYAELFNLYIKQNLCFKHNTGLTRLFTLSLLLYLKFLTHIYWGLRKKRYFGIRDNGKPYIKGINIIRKDTPLFMKDSLMDLVFKCMYRQINLLLLKTLRGKLKAVPYKLLGLIKTYSKSFLSYSSSTQHVKAALWANLKLDIGISADDIPYLFYIKSNCLEDIPVKKRHDTICLKKEDLLLIDKRNDIFLIDYDTYFDKQVVVPLTLFKYIPLVKTSLLEYKFINNQFYNIKPKYPCPICLKKHTTKKSALKCALKYSKSVDKNITVIKEVMKYIQGYNR